jgi:hypothetical protein
MIEPIFTTPAKFLQSADIGLKILPVWVRPPLGAP